MTSHQSSFLTLSLQALKTAIQTHITPAIRLLFPNLTKIRYHIHQGSQTCITLYDQLGKRISVLQEAYQPSGNHVFLWKHTDMVEGIYFIHIRAAHRQWVRRVEVS